MKRVSIRTRVLLYFVVLTALLLAVFASLLYLGVRRSLTEGLDADLRARATALAALVEREGDTWEIELEGATQPSRDLVRNLTAWTVLTHPAGEALLTSPDGSEFDSLRSPEFDLSSEFEGFGLVRPVELAGLHETVENSRERAFVGIFAVREEREGDDGDDEDGAKPLRDAGSGPAAVKVVVAADLDPVDGTLRKLLGILAAIGMATLLLATGAGTLLSRRIVRPLAQITEDAEAVRVPDGLREVHGSGTGDEIDRLAATLNRAFHRLHDAYERQRRFTADASHELRTPVSAMRSQAEVALRRERTGDEYREALGAVRGEAVRLGELIEALLLLARFDSGEIESRMQVVRLGEIARSCIAEFDPAARPEGIRLSQAAEADGCVRADPGLIAIVLRNLLSNALRHCSRPGSVEVRIGETGNQVVLVVRVDGSGSPQAALGDVFDRFYRVDDGRGRESGAAGLGLSIVAEIVRHHGGSVGVTSESGSGTRFTCRFPRMSAGEPSERP